MKIGVYVCRCGGLVADRLDCEALATHIANEPGVAFVRSVELACSDEGRATIVDDLMLETPDRVIVAACSPRDHQTTFDDVLARAGMNPYLVQLVNIREQAAWVTTDRGEATDKAFRLVRGALARVALHEPLERTELEVSPEVLVVGGGPAGLAAALTLAEAGRKVTLVEKAPILGGLPVRVEDLFPKLECGPCVLEPFLAEALTGPHASSIEILLLSEMREVKGSFGNFQIRVRQAPRHVCVRSCVGCALCVEACPATGPNAANLGRSDRKAMDFPLFGGLPNVPHIDTSSCLRFHGEACDLCAEACPVENTVLLDEQETFHERRVGAIVVAVGGRSYDKARLSHLGAELTDVLTAAEMERLVARNGPTQGKVLCRDGTPPSRVAFVHCAGSLDPAHADYCSGICCMEAFKLSILVGKRAPEAEVTHFVRSIVTPGKEGADLLRKVTDRGRTRFVTYSSPAELTVQATADGSRAVCTPTDVDPFDLVVLLPALGPCGDTQTLSKVVGFDTDARGFAGELHGLVHATRSRLRGVYLAGSCHAPGTLAQATTDGEAAAGQVLASLVPGRKVRLEAVHATVLEDRCSGCRTCIGVCPYLAIATVDAGRKARVDPALCVGCGTCVAACPSGAMKGLHFTTEQVFAEIEGVLQ